MASRGGMVDLLKRTWKDFGEDECAARAAALSYYTIFALPPLLVLILLVASAFVEPGEVQRLLTGQFRGMIGPEGARQIETMIGSVDRPDARKGLASLISVVGLVFGATGAFMQLQAALNRVWEVRPDQVEGGLRGMILKRILSLGMILGIAFILLVSTALSAFISATGAAQGARLGGLGPAVQFVFDLALSLAVVTLLFAAIFKFLPDVRIAWRDVWVGAFATALLFVLGKFAIGFYLGRSNPGQAFGAAGSLAVILVWIYYSSMIALLGAEFTESWAMRHGGVVRPEKDAAREQHPAPRSAPPPVVIVRREPRPRPAGAPSGLAVLAAALVDRFVRRRA